MQRADKRKYHYIYKITRFDGHFYIGMHSTDNLEDGYKGSGKRLWHSYKKHGFDAHTKEILEFLPTRTELKAREKEIVNETLLNEALCLNLQIGGEGGGGISSKNHQQKFSSAGGKVGGKIAGKLNGGNNLKRARAAGKIDQHGDKNHMFGKILLWITDGVVNRRVSPDILSNFLLDGWKRGRTKRRKDADKNSRSVDSELCNGPEIVSTAFRR